MAKKYHIVDCNGKDRVTLQVNGKKLDLVSGEDVVVPEHFCDALENSGVTHGPAQESDVDLGILDASIPDIKESIGALDEDELREVLAAEEAGKTRKGVVGALQDALKNFMG